MAVSLHLHANFGLATPPDGGAATVCPRHAPTHGRNTALGTEPGIGIGIGIGISIDIGIGIGIGIGICIGIGIGIGSGSGSGSGSAA